MHLDRAAAGRGPQLGILPKGRPLLAEAREDRERALVRRAVLALDRQPLDHDVVEPLLNPQVRGLESLDGALGLGDVHGEASVALDRGLIRGAEYVHGLAVRGKHRQLDARLLLEVGLDVLGGEADSVVARALAVAAATAG